MGHLFFVGLAILIGAGGVWGWILNCYKLIDTIRENRLVEFIVRVVGVFTFVLGAIIGYMDFRRD
jgi:hypothetical protein